MESGVDTSVGACSSLLSLEIVSAQDGPVLGAVGSFDWSGGAFLYPPNGSPTFINMSQEHVDMRDSYLGERRWGDGGGDQREAHCWRRKPRC